MIFRELSGLAADVKGVLDGLKIFKKVEVAAVSTGEQLLRELAAVKPLPGAFVCVGAGEFPEPFRRTATVAVIVIGEWAGTESGRASEIWSLLDSVADAFVSGDGEGIAINNVQYLAARWTPVDAPNLRTPAFALEIETDELASET